MEKPDIKLLALDMDGTTYEWGGDIVKANIKPIQEALAKGIEVVVVTGRPALSPLNKFLENGFGNHGKSFAVADNGACVYDFVNEEILEDKSIDAKTAKKVYELFYDRRFKGLEIEGFANDLHTVIDTRWNGKKSQKNLKTTFFTGQYIGYDLLREDYDWRIFKMMAYNISPEFLKELDKLGLEYAVNSHGKNCEINAHGVNKGTAVEWLAKQNKIKPENIMAIGDGANDVSMVKYAGYGTSLENSIYDVKKHAKIHIPLTNVQGGVAYAIDKYVLGK